MENRQVDTDSSNFLVKIHKAKFLPHVSFYAITDTPEKLVEFSS